MRDLTLLTLLGVFVSAAAQSAVVCHIPPEEPANFRTLIVGEPSVESHLLHGDSLGTCACPTTACEFANLYVQAGAKGKTEGTLANPFGSIEEALKAAEKDELRCVDLRLSAGLYAGERINQRRNLKIIGAEPGVTLATQIVNTGPFLLHIENIKFVDAPHGAPAAINIDNECASTSLHNVEVEGIRGQGIAQSGGAILIEDLTISGIERDESSQSGSGMSLQDGVLACVSDLNVQDNDLAGIRFTGQGTKGLVQKAMVERNGGDASDGQRGGIYVVDGAIVLGQDVLVSDNVLHGLFVGDASQANFRDVSIVRTERTQDSANTIVGVQVEGKGLLNLTAYSLCESRLAGALVDDDPNSSPDENFLFSQGLVAHNRIGLSFQDPDAQLEECLQAVTYVDNTVDLDSEFMPPPGGLNEQNCNDGEDNDLDLLTDCEDPDCGNCAACGGTEECGIETCSAKLPFNATWCDTTISEPSTTPSCPSPIFERCSNNKDDNNNGLIDCNDPDCQGSNSCP